MRNYEFGDLGEGDRPQEGEDRRDIGYGDQKTTKAQKDELRRRMEALSEGKPFESENRNEVSASELSVEKDLRRRMDALSKSQNETQEKSRTIQESDKKEAEELSKNLKEQMSNESGA